MVTTAGLLKPDKASVGLTNPVSKLEAATGFQLYNRFTVMKITWIIKSSLALPLTFIR